MEALLKELINKLKQESIFILFCITLIAFLWQSNQETQKELIDLNITTTRTIEQNNAILESIAEMLSNNRNNDLVYWKEVHERIEKKMTTIDDKLEEINRRIKEHHKNGH